jgi:PadR family transcriptional regulator, regulatory protein PadR
MKDPFSLGQLELKLLLAVLQCGNNAYGLQIQEELKDKTGKELVVGAIYTTMARLEERGFVESHLGDERSDRLGRPRRYFTVTGEGIRAIKSEQNELRRLTSGLKPSFGVASR